MTPMPAAVLGHRETTVAGAPVRDRGRPAGRRPPAVPSPSTGAPRPIWCCAGTRAARRPWTWWSTCTVSRRGRGMHLVRDIAAQRAGPGRPGAPGAPGGERRPCWCSRAGTSSAGGPAVASASRPCAAGRARRAGRRRAAPLQRRDRRRRTRGRLILTAHSGGGAALMRILRHIDPDEVHTFDALYSDPGPLIAWARRPAGQRRRRVAGALPAGEDTAANSRDVARALARYTPVPGGGDDGVTHWPSRGRTAGGCSRTRRRTCPAWSAGRPGWPAEPGDGAAGVADVVHGDRAGRPASSSAAGGPAADAADRDDRPRRVRSCASTTGSGSARR